MHLQVRPSRVLVAPEVLLIEYKEAILRVNFQLHPLILVGEGSNGVVELDEGVVSWTEVVLNNVGFGS